MTYRKLPSPNFNDRREGQKPSLIILHYTGTPSAQEAEAIYLMSDKVAPHYMVYGDGSVTQYVDEDKRAWHAGLGSWGRIDDVNSASIGIEIWNSGHENLFEDFLGEEITSLIALINDIRGRHDIADFNILGHSDVSAGRKIDPGEKFPWSKLAAAGIGLMPDINEEDERLALHWMDQPGLIVSALKEYGYDTQIDVDILLREFRRHFLPHTLEDWGADVNVCGALASLVRQKRKLELLRKHRAVIA